MRKIIMFSIALLIAHTSIAQKNYNYNDLYKSLAAMSDFEAYRVLFQYLQATTSKDYANSNAYYQLGAYMQKFMRDSDPFFDTESMQDYIRQANLYFSLSKRSLTEKDFKQYIQFYPSIKPKGDKLTMNDVIRDIDERLTDVNEYKSNVDKSLLYLYRSVNCYNNCITTFGDINQENNRLNDLYFLVDDKMHDKLNRLNADFDSTLYYLNKLKTSLESYPLGGYKINYSLQQIPVYRLYGLNSSDFLSKSVSLWDYRSWVQSFHQILNTDVAFLYSSAQEVNGTNTGYIKSLLEMNRRGIVSDYRINPLIVNKMLKYDFNSATAALLSYQEAKVNYLYSIADNKAGEDISSFDRFTKSPDAFMNTVRQKQKTDELLTDAKTKATPETTRKYAKFFESNYGGYKGYETHLNSEAGQNEQVMHNALNEYKNSALKSHIHTGNEKAITYNGKPLYFQSNTPASISGDGYYIHSKSLLSDKSMLVAGTYAADRQRTAFAAMIDSSATIKWLKEFRQANANSHAMLTALLNDGFAVVVSSAANDAVKNRMLLLDAAGNTKTSKDLPVSAVPQRMIYDDIAQYYVLAFKGSSFTPYSANSSELQICMLNAKLETVWNKSLTFEGYLSNVIKTDDNFYIYGAYSKLTDENGKQYNTEANRMNMFVYPISAGGSWLGVSTFDAPFSYYPLYVSKINNEYVDIIAVKDAQADKLVEEKSTAGVPYYMIIQSNRNLYYQYTGK
jgi:hypothetical protein